jgi:hypothetical protein
MSYEKRTRMELLKEGVLMAAIACGIGGGITLIAWGVSSGLRALIDYIAKVTT